MSFAGYFLSQVRPRKGDVATINRGHKLPNSDVGEMEGSQAISGIEKNRDLRLVGRDEAFPSFTYGSIPPSMLETLYNVKPPQQEMSLLSPAGELVNVDFGSEQKEPHRPITVSKFDTRQALDMKQEIAALRDTVHSLQEKVEEFEAKTLECNTFKDALAKAQHDKNKHELDKKQEIIDLKNSIESLQEKEKVLEMHLLEYKKFKDQEKVMNELENHLKVSSMEADISAVVIELLKREVRRLEDQVTMYSKVVAKLRSSRAKIRLLKRRLSSNSKKAKEKITSLYRTIVAVQDRECSNRKSEEEKKWNLNRLKDLEEEVMDLERENSRLSKENMDLTMKLESDHSITLTNSAGSEERGEMEEADCLRQLNIELIKQIDQLRADQYTDVEQLVYLRWINACLRYELRNQQANPGKVAATSLNKNLSLKSAEKAKELILEYAYPEEKHILSVESDQNSISSPQSSSQMETKEITNVSATKSKPRFLGKIKTLMMRKDTGKNKKPSSDETPRSETNGSVSKNSSDYDNNRAGVTNELSLITSEEAAIARDERCQSDLGCTSGYKRFSSNFNSSVDTSEITNFDMTPEKLELKKFADALRNSTRRSLSFSIC